MYNAFPSKLKISKIIQNVITNTILKYTYKPAQKIHKFTSIILILYGILIQLINHCHFKYVTNESN